VSASRSDGRWGNEVKGVGKYVNTDALVEDASADDEGENATTGVEASVADSVDDTDDNDDENDAADGADDNDAAADDEVLAAG
jgi:phosphopantothenoylcysteine synthetase/decarboxylase